MRPERLDFVRPRKNHYFHKIILRIATSDPPDESKERGQKHQTMSFYDEVELEDLTYHHELMLYTYPCPCGDQFEICLSDMRDGEEVAVCPSCSLTIRVIFDQVSFIFLSFFLPRLFPRPPPPAGRHITPNLCRRTGRIRVFGFKY